MKKIFVITILLLAGLTMLASPLGDSLTVEQANQELQGAVFVEIVGEGDKGNELRIVFQPQCPPPFACVNKTLVIANATAEDLSIE